MKQVVAAIFFAIGTFLMVSGPLVPVTGAKAKTVCLNKGGRGWGGSTESARFQAWEAVLQDTDWGMWAVWMASGAQVGRAASGYKVKSMREKCGNDGGSKVCTIRAKLCK